jgi:hypothetical protein
MDRRAFFKSFMTGCAGGAVGGVMFSRATVQSPSVLKRQNGAENIGSKSGRNVQQELDAIKIVDYASLRVALDAGELLEGDIVSVVNGGGPAFEVLNGAALVSDDKGTIIKGADSALYARRRVEGYLSATWWGAVPNDSSTLSVSQALQDMFDALPAYGSVQNGGSYQDEILLTLGGGKSETFYINQKVTVEYKNNWKFVGPTKLAAGVAMDADDYMLEFLACNHIDLGLMFVDGSSTQKRGIRISGDGFTGTKRNSTNIKSDRVFFREFAANDVSDTFEAVTLDTMSPNNTFGDYSIDDSIFENQNFLGCFGSAQRFASSEIIIDNCKYSFCSNQNDASADGVIVLGSGSSIKSDNLLATSTGPIFKPVNGSSIGRVSLHRAYTEQTQSLWNQTGGTLRALDIQGGYFASLKSAKFMDLSSVEAQVYLSGCVWPEDPNTNGFTEIDLGGESGSLYWVQQTGTSSWKSYRPRITNYGCFQSPSAFIQPSQGNYKRIVHMAQQSRINELKIFVDQLGDSTPHNLNFSDINEAIQYADQLGVTTCEFVLAGGQTHTATEAATFSGHAIFSSDGTGVLDVAAGAWKINGGCVQFKSLDLSGGDAAVLLDGDGKAVINGCDCQMGSGTNAFVSLNHGRVSIISPTITTGNMVKVADASLSTGRVEVSGTLNVANGQEIIVSLASQVEGILYSASNPTTGYWAKGMVRCDTFGAVAAAGLYMSVNVDAASINGGNWRDAVSLS